MEVMRDGSWKNTCIDFRSSRIPRTRAFNVAFRVIA